MRVTWKKEPDETGLARVVQGPRGVDLRVNGKRVAYVRPHLVASREYKGWWWCARSDEHGIPLRNTATTPVATMEEAKAACEQYVRSVLGEAG